MYLETGSGQTRNRLFLLLHWSLLPWRILGNLKIIKLCEMWRGQYSLFPMSLHLLDRVNMQCFHWSIQIWIVQSKSIGCFISAHCFINIYVFVGVSVVMLGVLWFCLPLCSDVFIASLVLVSLAESKKDLIKWGTSQFRSVWMILRISDMHHLDSYLCLFR